MKGKGPINMRLGVFVDSVETTYPTDHSHDAIQKNIETQCAHGIIH
jgi:hypothetical protein